MATLREFERVAPTAMNRRSEVKIVCSRCGVEDTMPSPLGKGIATGREESAAYAVRKFEQRGWVVGNRSKDDLCPSCARVSRRNTMLKEHVPMSTAPENKPAPTPSASKSIAGLYLFLEDTYDPAKRCYKDGWTDEKIAKALTISVELVTKRREQDFGPLVEDTLVDRIAAKRKLIGDLVVEARDAERALNDVKAKLSGEQRSLDALIDEAVAKLKAGGRING